MKPEDSSEYTGSMLQERERIYHLKDLLTGAIMRPVNKTDGEVIYEC